MKLNDYLLNKSWKELLQDEFKKQYFLNLEKYILQEYNEKTIYPKIENIFTALNLIDFNNLKVVIIGQDPYHGHGQAHGLCFSVLPPTKIPPSLRNIYKEIESDLNIHMPNHGDLTNWAKQGVLMLNSILTVEEASPMSHQKKGWEEFTGFILNLIDLKLNNIVFMAWGTPAQARVEKINQDKHLILKTVHPSPLSAHRGFLGSKHFSKCNEYLKSKNIKPIDWSLN